MKLEGELLNKLLYFQKSEITEYYIYSKLAKREKNPENKKVLEKIALEEKGHAEFFKNLTKIEVKPDKFKIFYFYIITILFGLTFGIKLMEKGETQAQKSYDLIRKSIPEIDKIISDEEEHEKMLIDLLKEELLDYIGSIVLGLNDALVELTGALAGFSLALRNTGLIALTGLITGIAASFSMAASEYLSHKSEGKESTALKASIYTGIAYIGTVFLLILPYLLLSSYMFALTITMIIAIMIILFFNFYISIAKDLNFKTRFLEMAFLSLGVAALSFGIGYVLRLTLGVEV